MWRVVKWIGIIVAFLIGALFIVGIISNKPKPTGELGPKAEALANKMLKAIDAEAWDSTRYVGWTFRGSNHYAWDRENDLIDVQWANHRVLLHSQTREGIAWTDDNQLDGPDAEKLVQTGVSYFFNDSFWLLAFTKLFDPGTERSVVSLKDGTDGLMITYKTGGVTPGDSYLWIMDKDGKPKSWRMWVNVLPIGGLEFTWENWKQLPTGAWVAQDHKNKLANVGITNIRGGMTINELELNHDPFAEATLISSSD